MGYLRLSAMIVGPIWLIAVLSSLLSRSTLAAPPFPGEKDETAFIHAAQLATGLIAARQASEQRLGEGQYTAGELIVAVSSGMNLLASDLLSHVAGVSVKSEIPKLGAILVSVPPGEEDVIAALFKNSGLFRYVERNAILTLPPSPQTPGKLPQANSLIPQFSPNDPYYSLQWGLPTIRAAQAWDISRGSATVLVGVIDSGYDVGHPDQPANLYVGPDYIMGGYVSYDGTGHGTHVAGIIAARTNNWTGVAALAHNVSVGVVRVLDSSGSGSIVNIAAAIVWATDAGSWIINLSLGSTTDARSCLQSMTLNV